MANVSSTCPPNVAIGALVANMMVDNSDVAEQGKLSNHEFVNDLTEEDVAQALLDLEQKQSGTQESVDAIKALLTNLSNLSDPELQFWINEELNEANSEKPSSALISLMETQTQMMENQGSQGVTLDQTGTNIEKTLSNQVAAFAETFSQIAEGGSK